MIDTRNQCAPGGGSHGTERNSSDNEAQRVPDQPETTNFGATGDANRDTSKFGAKGTT